VGIDELAGVSELELNPVTAMRIIVLSLVVLTLVKTLGKVVGSTLLFLIGFDIAGVLICFLLDLFSFDDSNSDMLTYSAVWLVLGLLCGLFSYSTAGKIASSRPTAEGTTPTAAFDDWATESDSGKTGLLVILTTFIVLAALAVFFNLLWWGGSMEPSGFVPDSRPLTLTFFGAVLASSVFAHKSMHSTTKANSKKNA
jgi:hypothetical protein